MLHHRRVGPPSHCYPADNAILRSPVTYRGQMLEIEIGMEKVEYTLLTGNGLTIRHEKEEIRLTREQR